MAFGTILYLNAESDGARRAHSRSSAFTGNPFSTMSTNCSGEAAALLGFDTPSSSLISANPIIVRSVSYGTEYGLT